MICAGIDAGSRAIKIVLIDSEDTLVNRFGQPNDAGGLVAPYFFTAANFLAYGNKLNVVRTVKGVFP